MDWLGRIDSRGNKVEEKTEEVGRYSGVVGMALLRRQDKDHNNPLQHCRSDRLHHKSIPRIPHLLYCRSTPLLSHPFQYPLLQSF